MKSKTIILGAGLAGISCLSKHPDAILLEKESYFFGHSASFAFREYYFDYGAHICHSRDLNWLKKLNLENANVINEACVKSYWYGSWIGYPVQNNLKDIGVELATIALNEIKKNNSRAPELTNYHSWAIANYGALLTERFYLPFTKKYWRTAMSEMSTSWLSGRLIPIDVENVKLGYEGKSKDQSVFNRYCYPKQGGFQDLFSDIKPKSDRIMFNSEVIEINPTTKKIKTKMGDEYHYDKLISSLPLTEYANILVDIDLDIKKIINKLKYNTLIVMGVIIRGRKFENLPHWFYVYDENIDISRVFNISSVAYDSSDDTILQLETFRRNDEQLNVEEISKNMLRGLREILSYYGNIEWEVKVSKYSYIVPLIENEFNVAKIRKYLDDLGIDTIGLYGEWKYKWSDLAYMDVQRT